MSATSFGKKEPFIKRLGETVRNSNQIPVLPETISRARQKLDKLNEELGTNTRRLADMGHDGDMMDDPQLHKAHEERLALEAERAVVDRFTQIAIPLNRRPSSVIDLGDRVTLDFGDDGEQTYTLGTGVDSGFNPREVISDDSPVGRAIMGKKLGNTVRYEIGGSQFTVKIRHP